MAFDGTLLPTSPPAQAPILILAWRGSTTQKDWFNFNFKFHPDPWSHESENILAHGAYINVVKSTLGRFESDIIGLIERHNVGRVYFTGHSLGGGVANVAHLVVRARLMEKGSPWARNVQGKGLICLAYTFAAPQTIVRLYDEPPDLIRELDAWSYNVVYGCDLVPRAPGMLKFLGNIFGIISSKEIASNPLVAKMCVGVLAYEFAAALSSQFGPIKLPSLVDNLISLTDEQREVMSKFTHLGTVVYKAPGTEEWEHFTTTAVIEKNLNVSGRELSELLASSYRDLNHSGSHNKDDLQNALCDAHSYYKKLSYLKSSSSSSSSP